MTGDRRILVDDTSRTLARIVDGLHDIATAMNNRRFAIVGGIAVLTHVQGHRVTQDVDNAARGRAGELHQALRIVAEPDDDGDADGLLSNGVPVDLLVAGPDAPKSSIGRGRQPKRREARGHALRWAIHTAISRELVCEPENPRGPVAVPVASVSALLAMKAIALTDLTRGEKTVTDRLDLWLLLTDDVDRAAAALQQPCDAPPAARRWVAEVLVPLLQDDPVDLVRQTATGHRAPRSVDDVEDVWQFVVEPHLELLQRQCGHPSPTARKPSCNVPDFTSLATDRVVALGLGTDARSVSHLRPGTAQPARASFNLWRSRPDRTTCSGRDPCGCSHGGRVGFASSVLRGMRCTCKCGSALPSTA